MDSEATGKNLKRAVKDQSENLEICVAGKFGSSEETIFANNAKNIPKEIDIEIFSASKNTGPKTVSASKVTIFRFLGLKKLNPNAVRIVFTNLFRQHGSENKVLKF